MLVGGCYRFAAMMTIKQFHDKPELMTVGIRLSPFGVFKGKLIFIWLPAGNPARQ